MSITKWIICICVTLKNKNNEQVRLSASLFEFFSKTVVLSKLNSWNLTHQTWFVTLETQTPSLERSKNLSGYEIAHNAGANVTYINIIFHCGDQNLKEDIFLTGSFASVAFYSKIHTWKHTTKKEKDYKDSLNLHSGCPVSLKAMPKINSEANNSWHCFQ